MDVMSPHLVWIDDSCYRINLVTETPEKDILGIAQPYAEEDLYSDSCEQEDFDIQETANGRFKTSIHVPSIFRGIVIGPKGVTKKRIETETKTTIEIPKSGNSGNIEIFGLTQQNVTTACRRIQLIVLSGRSKHQITHIACIPTIAPTIKQRFIQFKTDILNDPLAYGVDESVFQKPERLHLTICGLSLMDTEDRGLAAQIFCDYRPTISEMGPINFTICGVDCMNDDPSSINVLYAKVKCEPLQRLVDDIYEYFIAKGLVQREYDRVKMHVTLMNTRYNQTDNFDARNIMKTFANYDFGSMQLTEFHLSQRFTTGIDGFFVATGILKC